MSQTLFSIPVKHAKSPRAVYFGKRKERGEGDPVFEELSGRVARLAIAPVEGDPDGAHWLRRLDKDGKTVWQTRHPSLDETFWHAEWEYEVKREAWQALKPREREEK